MTADESNEENKSHIPAGEKYRDEKGIPAGRPGKDEDMAQAVLMLATNQYMSGQVRLGTWALWVVLTSDSRTLWLTGDTSSSILEHEYKKTLLGGLNVRLKGVVGSTNEI